MLLLAVFRPLRISSGWSTSTISSPLAEDGHPRLPEHQRMRHRERGEHAELRRAQLAAGGEHRLTLPDVLAGAADVHADVAIAHDGDHVRALVGVLLADHGVGPLGKRARR